MKSMNLKTHDAYSEIFISESEAKYAVRIFSGKGKMLRVTTGDCTSRKDGIEKGKKWTESVQDKYLKPKLEAVPEKQKEKKKPQSPDFLGVTKIEDESGE